jgi:hypothetical protein
VTFRRRDAGIEICALLRIGKARAVAGAAGARASPVAAIRARSNAGCAKMRYINLDNGLIYWVPFRA